MSDLTAFPQTTVTILGYVDADDEAYAQAHGKVYCTGPACMTPEKADELLAEGREIYRLGETEDADALVYHHTTYPGDCDLECDSCGTAVVPAP